MDPESLSITSGDLCRDSITTKSQSVFVTTREEYDEANHDSGEANLEAPTLEIKELDKNAHDSSGMSGHPYASPQTY